MCCHNKSSVDKRSTRIVASSSKAPLPHINLQAVFENDQSAMNSVASASQPLPPGYAEAMRDVALSKDDSNPSDESQDESLPKYAAISKNEPVNSPSSRFLTPTAPGFRPSVSFQIEARGHPLVALPFTPKPAHIPVYRVRNNGELSQELAYMSLRDLRGRGSSCLLVDGETRKVGAVTSYRFGPGKPVKLRYIQDGPVVSVDDDEVISRLLKEEEVMRVGDGKGKSKEKKQSPGTEQVGEGAQLPHSEVIEIISNGFSTRSHTFLTPLGTFRWRYGTKAERLEVDADELLILERIYTVAVPSTSRYRKDKVEERRKRVAMFVRNDEFRTEGTGPREAGNGGRLSCDFGEWEGGNVSEGNAQGGILEEKRSDDGVVNDERREVEVLTVASCLSMLKKEVDRRRVHQAMVIVGTGAL